MAMMAGWFLSWKLAADGAGGIDAAHDGHLQIHEDDVERHLGDHFDGFLAVVGDLDLGVTETLEEHAGDLLIQRLVFDEEDAGGMLDGEAISAIRLGGFLNGAVGGLETCASCPPEAARLRRIPHLGVEASSMICGSKAGAGWAEGMTESM
jgi:hypothetical protein